MSEGAVTYSETIWDALQAEYGSARHSSELLARTAGVVPRTAKNWLERKCAPRGEELVRLMAANDRVAETMRDLVMRQREELRLRGENVRARHAALGRGLFMGLGEGASVDQQLVHDGRGSDDLAG